MSQSLKPLKIYKSSAGSGKTYQLVLSYLSIILKDENPDTFKRILAITFTNKACAEMKERILQGLEKIVRGEDLRFIQDFEKSTLMSFAELQEKAQVLLTNILHNYGSLNILTIDKFVHRIIRSFSRELGLNNNFELEFDFDIIVQRCVDEVLKSVGDDPEITKVLIEYYQELISQDELVSIEDSLNKNAKVLQQEDASVQLQYYKDKSLSDFNDFAKNLKAEIKNLNLELKSKAKDIQAIFTGVDTEGFKYGQKSYMDYVKNILSDKPIKFTESNLKNIKEEKWISATNAKKLPELSSILERNSHLLKDLFLAIYELSTKSKLLTKVYKNLTSFSLLNQLQTKLNEFKEDNNIIFIKELNEIISKVVRNEPAPFIYEKIGNRFDHYFIDEFQDTSQLQWNNLIPLVYDSLSTNNENLIVGDAKQSIYRWRGGDAKQFIDLPKVNADIADLHFINDSFDRNHQVQTLADNYRSAVSIISFNNWFFEQLTSHLSEYPTIQKMYEDVGQKCTKVEEGLVKIQILEDTSKSEDFDSEIFSNLKDNIDECLEDGFGFQDICILSRTKKEGVLMSKFLLSIGINVISQESLVLSESKEVLSIFYLLQCLQNSTSENVIKAFYYNTIGLTNLELFAQYRIPAEDPFYNDGFDFNRFITDNYPDFDRSFFQNISTYDKVDYLINLLHFNRNNYYVDKLLNVVFEFQNKNGHSTGRFIEYFNEQMSKISVSPPENSDAITIMTVHKSKGLQFPIVMLPIPFESPRHGDAVWIKTELLKKSGLENFSLQLDNEIITEEIEPISKTEKELQIIDTLNVLYVALTRPEKRLYINFKTTKTGGFPNNLGNFIQNHPEYDSEKNLLCTGKRSLHSSHKAFNEKKEHNLDLSEGSFEPWENKLVIATNYKDESREWGNAIHTILQDLNNLNDLDQVLNKFLAANPMWASFESAMREELELFTNHSEVKEIYADAIEFLSEQALIDGNGEELRPDKVILKKDVAILIDFKSGAPLNRHKKQIEKYHKSLSNLLQTPIKMYLIYLSTDKTEVVNV